MTTQLEATEAGIVRAGAFLERLDPATAVATLEPVLAADPGSAEGWILMGRLRLVLEQPQEALVAATRALEIAPQDPRPPAAASRALTLLGRHEEAVTMAYRAVIAEPANPLWHDRVAWALLASDRQLADAEQAARTAIGLDPGEAHYYYTHGLTLAALGHVDQARQALMISLRLEPANPQVQARLDRLNSDQPVRGPEPVAAVAQAKKKGGWKLFKRKS